MKTLKKIAILGSTGSIGKQTLDIIRSYPEDFTAEVLVAHSNVELLITQAKEFEPNIVIIADETKYLILKEALSHLPIKIFAGSKSIEQVVSFDCIDIVLVAMVGFSGLLPTLKAIEAGKRIALANKECLVVAGSILKEKLTSSRSVLIPVDSEHSAIFQCLLGETSKSINKLILTASGGPFRGKKRDFLQHITPIQALQHPNWKMGNKVSIDSASLMNKGLEVIEAHWLFDISVDNIEVVIHPQSIIHSLVEFTDGSIKAQLGLPDMRLPIQYALSFPDRLFSERNRFSFIDYPNLSFETPDTDTFKNLSLAYHCIKKGGNQPCIMNAANEIAVDLFLKGEIGFLDIPELIESCLSRSSFILQPSIQDCIETDIETRQIALDISKHKTINKLNK